MNVAIIGLSLGGSKKAKYLRDKTGYDLYLSLKHKEKVQSDNYFEDLDKLVENLFASYDAIIFIMAIGIVVRKISPYIKNKTVDPAIIVMDEKFKNVIPILSGHIGGANDLSLAIASIVGANPVITTASDVLNKMAVDSFSMKYDLVIDNMVDAKDITARIVDNLKVGLYSSYPYEYKASNVYRVDSLDKYKYNIIISSKNIKKDNSVLLIKKELVLGIGCRKDTCPLKLEKTIINFLKDYNYHIKAIKKLATVDIKKDEKAILTFSKKYNIELEIISREEIKKVEDRFESSAFVKKTIGVGSVSEPVAYLSSNKGECLVKKHKLDGITLSIFNWRKK